MRKMSRLRAFNSLIGDVAAGLGVRTLFVPSVRRNLGTRPGSVNLPERVGQVEAQAIKASFAG
jgi:hypothetical protein